MLLFTEKRATPTLFRALAAAFQVCAPPPSVECQTISRQVSDASAAANPTKLPAVLIVEAVPLVSTQLSKFKLCCPGF